MATVFWVRLYLVIQGLLYPWRGQTGRMQPTLDAYQLPYQLSHMGCYLSGCVQAWPSVVMVLTDVTLSAAAAAVQAAVSTNTVAIKRPLAGSIQPYTLMGNTLLHGPFNHVPATSYTVTVDLAGSGVPVVQLPMLSGQRASSLLLYKLVCALGGHHAFSGVLPCSKLLFVIKNAEGSPCTCCIKPAYHTRRRTQPVPCRLRVPSDAGRAPQAFPVVRAGSNIRWCCSRECESGTGRLTHDSPAPVAVPA